MSTDNSASYQGFSQTKSPSGQPVKDHICLSFLFPAACAKFSPIHRPSSSPGDPLNAPDRSNFGNLFLLLPLDLTDRAPG
jgi:hypothetical protein